MRAVVMTRRGGPEVLEVREMPWPEAGVGELLVRVRATTVNPVDLKLRAGRARVALEPPAVLGYDVSGVVEETGHGVRDFRPGDEVFYTPEIGPNGTYADYHVVPETIVAHKPSGLSHPEAAALALAGSTAWQALVERGGVGVGQTVLVYGGSGGVGSMAVQIARAAGARVIATCRAPKADLCRELGAAHVVDHASEDVVEAVLAATDGEGVDLTLDTVGGETLAHSLAATRCGGRLVTIVSTTGDLAPAYLRNQTLEFLFLRHDRATLEHLTRLVDRGLLRPVVDSVLPLERAGDGHRRLEQGGVRGKIVLLA